MTPHILTGSAQEIAAKVVVMGTSVREAIVFVDDQSLPTKGIEDVFAEMEPYTIQQVSFDDSREGIYQRVEGE
jgi:hypothetical protein